MKLFCPNCGRAQIDLRPMTRKQSEVYGAVVDYYKEHGIPPSIEELCEVFDRAPATIYEHLMELYDKGWVSRTARYAQRDWAPVKLP